MKRSLAVLLVAGLVTAAGPTAAAVAVGIPGEGPPGVSVSVPGDAASTVAYEPSDSVIANPQRGFYHHTATHFNTAKPEQNTPLTEADLAGLRSKGITQILRVVYLEDFAANPVLDERVLSQLQADYDTARTAGISVITRFAYVGDDGGATPPYGDAPLDIVLAHIKQLGPVLRANADVIPVVQNGFIGRWGEGYYTDHFVADPANPGVVTEQDWANRSAVTQALLDELPADRGVQVRTMATKQHLLNVPPAASSAVTAEQAFTDTPIARIGHHNDCFLSDYDDGGTYLSDPRTLDYEYLAADSVYVPVGGETCKVVPSRSEWETASVELARYHYSYLNTDYNRLVLDSWGEPALDETAKRLGYRFVMESSTVTPAEDSVEVSVDIRNDGWAAPYLPRTAMLQLTGSDGTSVSVPFTSNADARHWLAGTTTTLSTTLSLSDPAIAALAEGSYSLSLALPSSDARTAGDPRFAVQAANLGTWNETDGTNALNQAVVVGPRAAAPSAAPAFAGAAVP
ncbi:DUF4832 domain-containing protein [Arthrobacter sp. zg-Y40]|uniref:DUF4832 domain-containing protein n=1 Tax=Arthrobacter sp. zg-Y40 TaxID=2886939 RepID=UPI001D15315A|nr:DUF4832 domain-containing protein [Arthrobacter sp. zg-Y40]MCC3278437.1 DUF4832 domain-containing protein [Arthrobacter sp. zg-Y40]